MGETLETIVHDVLQKDLRNGRRSARRHIRRALTDLEERN